jgi:hypothetical protein
MQIFTALLKLFSQGNDTAVKAATDAQCCKYFHLGTQKEDLGHANSFEFMHAQCQSCGAHWIEVFSVSNGVSGRERITDEKAKLMLATRSGAERKAFMKSWSDESL